MQNQDPSHPYVDSVSMIFPDKITLSVEVTEFQDQQGWIEISGQATQAGGAFATISEVVDVAKAAKKDDGWFVDVTAKTIPPAKFDPAQEITIFVRVARAWVTVLDKADVVGEDSTPGGAANTQWGRVKGSAQLTKEPW